MKIVHVILTSRFAGSERYMIELANAQSADHEVSVILQRDAAEQRPDALAHRLDPKVRQIHVSPWRLLSVAQVRRRLREINPDVVHAHLSLACRSLRGFKTDALRLATLHIHYKPQQHADLDALIAIAPWQMAAIPPPLRERTRQIDNWTRLDAAGRADEQLAARLSVRRELGLADGDYLIGAMGRAESSKGMDLLIQAFDAVRAPGVRLAVAGAGREWQKLRRLAPPDVIMPGFVVHPAAWYAAFDAFVSPSRSEPFGLALLEAMASGLPVLATASEGARHLAALIERPLVPCDDVAALAQGLRELVATRPARRAYDLQSHSIDAKVAEIESWYRLCLQRKRTAPGD